PVVLSLRLAHDLTDLRMLGLGRIRRRFSVCELAGVASEAQNASGRKRFELANQAAVLRGKESRVRELLNFIRQADKVDRHMRTGRIAGDGEGNPDVAVALRMKTHWRQSAGCGNKKFSSGEHRASRFIAAGPFSTHSFRSRRI